MDVNEYFLTLCMHGNFACFIVVCWFFFKINFFKNYFVNTIRVPNSLDSDQARHFVGPDLVPNCLEDLTLCMLYCRLLIFFSKSIFLKIISWIPSETAKQFGFRSGRTKRRTWSGSKLFERFNSVHALLSSADFFQNQFFFFKFFFVNAIRVPMSLDSDQAQHFVGPDLVPNCLQRLSADDKSRH